MLARIHVDDGTAAAALTRALAEADCLAVRRNAVTIDVLTRRGSHGDSAQARIELAFFLKAWAADHAAAPPRVAW